VGEDETKHAMRDWEEGNRTGWQRKLKDERSALEGVGCEGKGVG
jgi:hypothetical protein